MKEEALQQKFMSLRPRESKARGPQRLKELRLKNSGAGGTSLPSTGKSIAGVLPVPKIVTLLDDLTQQILEAQRCVIGWILSFIIQTVMILARAVGNDGGAAKTTTTGKDKRVAIGSDGSGGHNKRRKDRRNVENIKKAIDFVPISFVTQNATIRRRYSIATTIYRKYSIATAFLMELDGNANRDDYDSIIISYGNEWLLFLQIKHFIITRNLQVPALKIYSIYFKFFSCNTNSKMTSFSGTNCDSMGASTNSKMISSFLASKVDHPGTGADLKLISFLSANFCFPDTDTCEDNVKLRVPVFGGLINGPRIDEFDSSFLNVRAFNKIQERKFFRFGFLILEVKSFHKAHQRKRFKFYFLILNVKLTSGTFQTDLSILHFGNKVY